MKRSILIVAILFITIASVLGFNHYSGKNQISAFVEKIQKVVKNKLGFGGINDILPATPSGDKEIVKHIAYTLSYCDKYKQPYWVAYILTKTEVEAKDNPRKNNFREDPDVPTGSAVPADYAKSGYDKGHMAPAGDFSWSEQAMSESFYMSNMSPQVPNLNRGLWSKLEAHVREWAVANDTVCIIVGPVLTSVTEFIGEKNKIGVPKYYYKVILDASVKGGFKAIAFIMPNEKIEGDFFRFAVSVDSVEKVTGYHFFPSLNQKIIKEIDKKFNLAEWK